MPDCAFAAIADDFTGGADLAGMLAERGVRTLQCFGVPPQLEDVAGEYDAVVVCLKSRSIAADAACRVSLEALAALRPLAPRQIQFKYCSTFDSTEQGNIGPVTEALMNALHIGATVAVPALPVNGRTQYMGHLFVNGQLLSDSPLRDHPLNPMRQSNLVEHLRPQTRLPVGLVDLNTVRSGPAAIRAALEEGIYLVDAIADEDLATIAEAVADAPLITGGSGLAMSLPGLRRNEANFSPPSGGGPALVLAGSCSAATLEQLRVFEAAGYGTLRMSDPAELNAVARGAQAELEQGRTVCIRSSAPADERRAAPEAIEAAFAELARRLVPCTRRIVVAGGETSGAVVNALEVRMAEVVRVIDPGVPALRTLGDRPLFLALKSGNFGAHDFFLKAIG